MPQSKTIIQDGKRYTFTPGANGSLQAQPLNPPVPQPSFLDPRQPVARTVPQRPNPGQLAMNQQQSSQPLDPLAQLRMLLAR